MLLEVDLVNHSQGDAEDFQSVLCESCFPARPENDGLNVTSAIAHSPLNAKPSILRQSRPPLNTDGFGLQQLSDKLVEREESDISLVALSTCQRPTTEESRSSSQTIYDSVPLGELPTTIRILEVEQQLDESEPVIKGRLRVVDLDCYPAFTALSYVWGDASVKKTIWIDGKALSVTTNAWEALRRLRNKFPPLRIWIDAVCINQLDRDEKDRQIPLMGPIYSRANRVYIWLGEGNEKTERAMRYLETGALLPLSCIPPSADADSSEDGISVDKAPLLLKASRMRLRTLWHLSFRAIWHRKTTYLYHEIEELFSHPWIDRVWTLQEVLTARHPIFVCGDLVVPWPAFVCAAGILDVFRPVDACWKDFVIALCKTKTGPSLPPNCESWLDLVTIRCRQREAELKTDPTPLSLVSERAQRSQTADIWPLQIIQSTQRNRSLMVFLILATSLLAACLIFASGIIAVFKLRGHNCIDCLDNSVIVFVPAVSSGIVFGVLFRFCKAQSRSIRAERPKGPRVNERSAPWRLVLMFQIAKRQCSVRTDHYRGVLAILRHPQTATRTGLSEAVAGELQDTPAYRSLCLDLIDYSGSLDFLAFLSPGRANDVSSWVVQWHEADAVWPSQGQNIFDSATPDSKPWYVCTHDISSELKVLGVQVGRVAVAFSFEAVNEVPDPPLWTGLDAIVANYAAIGRTWIRLKPELDSSRNIVFVEGDSTGMVNGRAQVDDLVFLLSGLSWPIILRQVQRGVDCSFRVIGTAFLRRAMDGQLWTEDIRSRLREITLV